MYSKDIEINNIRNKLINAAILGMLIIVIPGIVLSILRTIKFGWDFIYIPHFIGYLFVIFLCLFRNKLSTNFKIYSFVSFFVTIGFVGTFIIQLSDGFYYCYVGAMLITLLFGKKQGVIFSIISLIGILIVAFGYSMSLVKSSNNPPPILAWINIIMASLYAFSIIVYSLGLFYTFYMNTIEQLQRKNAEYEQINEKWRNVNKELIQAKEFAEKSEKGLLEQNKLLEKAKQKAEESDRLKAAFLNNMSHEVRTPLNTIQGFSKLLLKPNQPAEKLKLFTDKIQESSNKLIEIMTDVIEISQIHANQHSIKPERFEFIGFMQSICNDFKKRAEDKKLIFQFILNINLPELYIVSDIEKLIRILAHLLDNALKFTNIGSILLDIDTDNSDNIVVTIADTGIGISEEMQKHLFVPFRQAETGITREFGGNGLGLAIVRAYCELLNFSIKINSELGIGTTVTILMPYEKKQNEIPIKNEIIPVARHIKNFLIVEDELSNFHYISELINDLNVNILYAENGQKAVDLCKENPEIDIVLMDIKMPVLDGYSATKQIKAFRSDLPIIAQTAYALENEKELYNNIFDEYVTKPIFEEELLSVLAKFIAH